MTAAPSNPTPETIENSTQTTTPDTFSMSRRSALRGVGLLGAGLFAFGSARPVAAAEVGRRESYRILAGTEYETSVSVYDSGRSGPTTMVVGGMHGDEQSGFLAADRIAEWCVDAGKLVVVPRANVVAIADDSRTVDGVDLNRQFPPLGGDCMHPLAAALWAEVVKHDPDWAFDLHSSRGIYKSGDGGVGQAVYPTWTAPARAYGRNVVDALNAAFDLDGDTAYLLGNTVDADRYMLMHRVAGMLDRPGYICETTEKCPLDEQVAWHLFTVEHVMNQFGQRKVSGTTEAKVGSGDSESPEADVVADDPAFDAMNVTVDPEWQTFALDNVYDDPIVIANPLSIVGDDPAHARVRYVGHSTFHGRVEEWAYGNDRHYDESVGVFAMDPGVYTLADGTRMEVGFLDVGTDPAVVQFTERFDRRPVVLAQSNSERDGTPVVTRISGGPWTDGFEVSLQMEESKTGESHDEEIVGWVAIERGTGVIGGRAFEAGKATVESRWHRIDFDGRYENPVFVAGIESYNDDQPCGLRHRNLTESGVEVFVEEEDSLDDDRTHAEETVSYLVVEGR